MLCMKMPSGFELVDKLIEKKRHRIGPRCVMSGERLITPLSILDVKAKTPREQMKMFLTRHRF